MAGYGRKSASAPEERTGNSGDISVEPSQIAFPFSEFENWSEATIWATGATATRLMPTRARNTSQLSRKDCAVVQKLIFKYNLDDAASFQEYYKGVFYSLQEQEALELLYAWVVELCGGQALIFATPPWWPKTIHHTCVEDLAEDDRKKLLLHILCGDHEQDIQREIPFKVPFKKLFDLLQTSSIEGSRKVKVKEVFVLRKFEILNKSRLRGEFVLEFDVLYVSEGVRPVAEQPIPELVKNILSPPVVA
ncbi:hypothetical protein NUU61_001553 [Penicillium alfredii]|uniref:Subtelomeric hrmA-associated cluster protein AFUB-079030/YDR124W-like helical bundle domain-containing protein n=1 Tax=Penicillium alfredii TaxID=1506179 RepID=A0A9W9G4I1_9EURO|nr:uncharacterized protein NUU61_001553 [Penicillium alfredii]KAJ5111923.1 hypothetical protein NUU61_001553 [Penicillium alfredii]